MPNKPEEPVTTPLKTIRGHAARCEPSDLFFLAGMLITQDNRVHHADSICSPLESALLVDFYMEAKESFKQEVCKEQGKDPETSSFVLLTFSKIGSAE